MSGVLHGILILIVTVLGLRQVQLWQQAEQRIMEYQKDDYSLYYCARIAALRQNLHSAQIYLVLEGLYQDVNDLEAMINQELEAWRTVEHTLAIDCHRYQDHFEIYRQWHKNLPESYPNFGIRWRRAGLELLGSSA